ncbi:hypothetical protein HYH02_003180 [Chlamydomonas schloesseri]|uniref:Uncharacterized protein n=1 Tax=Chlamydomonas schloesseri TaxID=2026947 RepID=A0A835WRS0_9CHLO|nr:hypothetical protein HYH02_003180 [Chlamydomonas schloesseri]|eukprot:KAG2452148.1 hypothetical protein HYH02_003180 [Chlamydomonas schloesseri]
MEPVPPKKPRERPFVGIYSNGNPRAKSFSAASPDGPARPSAGALQPTRATGSPLQPAQALVSDAGAAVTAANVRQSLSMYAPAAAAVSSPQAFMRYSSGLSDAAPAAAGAKAVAGLHSGGGGFVANRRSSNAAISGITPGGDSDHSGRAAAAAAARSTLEDYSMFAAEDGAGDEDEVAGVEPMDAEGLEDGGGSGGFGGGLKKMLGGLKGSVTAAVGGAAKKALGGGRSAALAAAANGVSGGTTASRLLGRAGSSAAAELVPTARTRSLTAALNPLLRMAGGGGSSEGGEAAEDEGGEAAGGGGLLEGLPRMGSGALASGSGVRFVGGGAAPPGVSSPVAGGSKARLVDALRSGGSFTAGGSGAVSRATSFSSKIAGGGGGGPPGGAHLYTVRWLDFSNTPERAGVKAAAERLAKGPFAKNASRCDDMRQFPGDAVTAAGKEGFGGVAVPASAGGLGLCANDAAIVFEALGMGDTAAAGYLTLHNMVAWLVHRFGSPGLQQQVLRNLSSTALLAAYAASEPSSGSDAAATATTATPAAGGYLLNGTKVFVAGAGVADVYCVLARTSEQPTKGLSLFLVNKSTPGVIVGKSERCSGWRSVPLASLTLRDAAVRADALLGREGQGLDILNLGLDLVHVWLGAVSVGGAQLALDYVISWDKGRKQGTKALTDLQALQFRLVELHAELQAARLLVRSAAQQVDAKAPSRSMAAAQAKQFATDTAATVAAAACSLMGGAGMVGEHPPERIARDLRAHTVVGGANEFLLGRIFSDMQKQQQ